MVGRYSVRHIYMKHISMEGKKRFEFSKIRTDVKFSYI